MMGRSKEGGDRLLSVILSNMARGCEQSLKHIIFHLNVRMYLFFFAVRAAEYCSMLPREVVSILVDI